MFVVGGKATVIVLCIDYNQDNTMEELRRIGLQGTKRIENIQMGLARAVDIRNSTGKSIICKTKNKQETKTVMKGDFDSPAKLEIF